MSIWAKICGNTSLQDALLAAEAGADAVGFVFAPSPRQVTAKQVESIVSGLPGSLEKIGVFVDLSFEEIGATVLGCGLSGVQVHSNRDPHLTAKLRERFGRDLRLLRVLHYSPGLAEEAAAVANEVNIDAVLLDSRTAAAVGGTGVAYDWHSAAAALSKGNGLNHRIVVAGGLTPGNVAEAIGVLRPWGVDVVSGVEAAPGRKDPEKVRTFIAEARAAMANGR
jgi:phosphoribosylanthranilate isomerase